MDSHQKLLLGRGERRKLEFVFLLHSAVCSRFTGCKDDFLLTAGVSWTSDAICEEAQRASPPCCYLTTVSRDHSADGEKEEKRGEEIKSG